MRPRTRFVPAILLCACSASLADEPKRDRYGDPLPDGASARLGSLHLRHEAAILTAAFTADGKSLVTGDALSISFWDSATGKCVRRVPLNQNVAPGQLRHLSNDAKVLMLDDFNHVLHFLDAASGAEQRTLNHAQCGDFWGKTLELSRDGRSLAVRVFKGGALQTRPASSELRLHDVKTNKSIVLPRATEQGGVGHLTFTPDSRRLAASCTDGVLLLWDRDTGKLVREVPRVTLDGSPVHLAFAADGRSFAALMSGKARIREIASGADRLHIPLEQGLFSLAYSPDARFIACGQGDDRVVVYSAVSGKQLAQWQSKQGYIPALAFSRDGRLLASGGVNGTILIWKVPQDGSVPVVRNAEEAVSLWQALGNTDAAAANRALAGLTVAPAQTLPLFKERLPPLVKLLDQRQFARLVAELDDDSFQVRERATRELALIGADAADALHQALHNDPSAEVKRRIDDLLARLKTGGDSERLRFLRAVEVLERIGTPQARELLRELAGKPMASELGAEVQASLRRMGEQP